MHKPKVPENRSVIVDLFILCHLNMFTCLSATSTKLYLLHTTLGALHMTEDVLLRPF